jgi:hypothetical protein
VKLVFSARSNGTFRIIPCAVLYRLDGIVIFQHIGEPINLHLAKGEKREAILDFGPLALGDGNYIFSVALYRNFDPADIEKVKIYDLIDRSFEFSVFGNPPFLTALVHRPAKWSVV